MYLDTENQIVFVLDKIWMKSMLRKLKKDLQLWSKVL